MEKAFIYGMSVEGNNFTDRIEETKRIKADFEHGINVILTKTYGQDFSYQKGYIRDRQPDDKSSIYGYLRLQKRI